MTKQNKLNVRVGDRVAIVFSHYEDKSEIEATVTKIDLRSKGDGITYIPHTNMEHDSIVYEIEQGIKYNHKPDHFCDASFITRIIQRAPFNNSTKGTYVRRSAYREGVEPNMRLYSTTNKGILCTGTIHELVMDLLSLANKYPEFGLREDINQYWYDIGCPGMVKRDRYCVYLNRKSFTKWLNRAAKYLAKSKRQAFVEENERHAENEREYFSDVENNLWD